VADSPKTTTVARKGDYSRRFRRLYSPISANGRRKTATIVASVGRALLIVQLTLSVSGVVETIIISVGVIIGVLIIIAVIIFIVLMIHKKRFHWFFLCKLYFAVLYYCHICILYIDDINDLLTKSVIMHWLLCWVQTVTADGGCWA